jgi:hypothetical protein
MARREGFFSAMEVTCFLSRDTEKSRVLPREQVLLYSRLGANARGRSGIFQDFSVPLDTVRGGDCE